MKFNSSKKGGTNIYLAFIISMFFLVIFFIYMIMYIHPPKVYSDISQIGRKYIIKMEIDGYLTNTNLINLQNDLIALNLNMSNVTIIAPSIKVNYTYVKIKTIIDGFNITKTSENIPMQVKLSLTSTNGS